MTFNSFSNLFSLILNSFKQILLNVSTVIGLVNLLPKIDLNFFQLIRICFVMLSDASPVTIFSYFILAGW